MQNASRSFAKMLFVIIACIAVVIPIQNSASQIIELSRDPNDVHFFLFPDPSNPDVSEEIIFNDANSLQNSRFNPSLSRTVFITHGFRSNVSSDMPQTVKNAFLASGLQYNIIVVSWGDLSTPLPADLTAQLYFLVVGNVPIVAERLTEFIIFLKQQNAVELENLYLIGHSLGSHVSGLTGRNINQRTGTLIPRITGLDPAGPLFFPPIRARNIDKSDAKFVQIIHTNMGTLGDTTKDGHADFYPNGGVQQPNCAAGDTASPNTLGRCSHWYSYQLYAASITRDFPACPCNPFRLAYPLGLCSGSCKTPITLGFNCPSTASGEFYATTTNPI